MNIRTFWENVDMSKNLYSRFGYLSVNFRYILTSGSNANKSGIPNKELLDLLLKSNTSGIGPSQKTEFYDMCRDLDKFYTECFLFAKNNGIKLTEKDMCDKGFNEEKFKVLLKSLSEFISCIHGLIIPDNIKAIYQDVRPKPGILEMKEELERASLSDLVNNSRPRFPAIFIVDNSVYMGENGIFAELQSAMKKFFVEIAANKHLSEITELYIATCGGAHNEIVNFATIARQRDILERMELKPYGRCMMGNAINRSLDKLEKRIAQMTNEDIDVQYYCPWIIILSNGKFKDTEEMERACARLRELKKNGDIQVYPIGLTGDADMNALRMLDEQEAYIMTSLNGFFSDVFYSLGWSRRSTPGGDRVMLRHPEGFEA